MSDDAVLPKENNSQRIGHRANKCFSAYHPDSWRPHSLEGTDDVGFDYQVQLVVEGNYVGIFRVQLKGSESPTLNATEEFYSIPLSRSTVNYYARVADPILLVFCDLSVDLERTTACPAFYVWIHDELKRFREEGRDGSGTDSLVVRIPVGNRLTEEVDLRADVEAHVRLHKVAVALDEVVEEKLPSISPDERASLLENVSTGLSQYSGALLQVMAAPATTPWPAAPRDSFAGKLDEASRHLSTGSVDKAMVILDDLEPSLEVMTSLETAEYWYCRGGAHSRTSDEFQASADYARACEYSGDIPRHLTAWVEAELVLRFQPGKPLDLSDLKARLLADTAEIKVMLARLMATEGDFDGAYRILNALPRSDALKTLAIVAGMQGKHDEVARICSEGLSSVQKDSRSTQLYHVLRARANFMLAIHAPHDTSGESEIVIASATGPADLDVTRLRTVWDDVQAGVALLRQAGWPNNVEFIADVWCAAAVMLGRATEALDAAKEAAAARPQLPMLQWSLETLAIQTEDYDAALKANALQPESASRTFRRIGVLHQAKRHRLCLEAVEAACDALPIDQELYPVSVALGVLSADVLFLADRAHALVEKLESKPEWGGHVAILRYFRATGRNVLGKDEALKQLISDYEVQGRPRAIALQLFHVLDASKQDEAEVCITVAARIREFQQLSIEGEGLLAQAYATLSGWNELLNLADRVTAKFSHVSRFFAIRAFALDKLGRTPEALAELRRLLDGHASDRLTVDTYVNIVTRCGFTEEALQLAEQLLNEESEKSRRIDCLRLLFNLLHAKEPGSQRAVEVAWEIGRLVDQNDEEAEGQFLSTFLMATLRSHGSSSLPERIAEFQKRMTAFTDRWPESRLLRRGNLPQNATPRDFQRMLREVLGDFEERRAWQQKVEKELGRGELPIPYIWRPRTILMNVRDVGELWEMGKRSQKDARQYHLPMIAGSWSPRTRRDTVAVVPLLDLTALFVLQDLDLLGVLFKVFPTVAVSQAMLLEIQRRTSPIVGSLVQPRFAQLVEALKLRFESIQQPVSQNPVEDNGLMGQMLSDDVRDIARSGRYWVYSDDAFFRIYATDSDEAARSFCTLDLLAVADEMGLMTPQQVSEKIGLLCSWNVGLAITPRYLLASIPPAAGEAKDVSSAIDAIRATETCTAIFEGIWNVRKPYTDITAQAASLLSGLAANGENDLKVISAIVGLWLGKAKLRADAGDSTPIQRLALLVALAAGQSSSVSQDFSRRLWSVYTEVTALEHGNRMDEQREREAIETMAMCCARLDRLGEGTANSSRYRDAMLVGMTHGTADHERFGDAYAHYLIASKSAS
ncbi:DUF4365 domain-containing protein [Burkholderia sp. AW49-1]